MITDLSALRDPSTAARLTEELSRSGYGFQPFLLTDAGPVKHDSLAADSRWRNHLLVPREGPGVVAFRDTLAAFGAN